MVHSEYTQDKVNRIEPRVVTILPQVEESQKWLYTTQIISWITWDIFNSMLATRVFDDITSLYMRVTRLPRGCLFWDGLMAMIFDSFVRYSCFMACIDVIPLFRVLFTGNLLNILLYSTDFNKKIIAFCSFLAWQKILSYDAIFQVSGFSDEFIYQILVKKSTFVREEIPPGLLYGDDQTLYQYHGVVNRLFEGIWPGSVRTSTGKSVAASSWKIVPYWPGIPTK